MDAIEWRDGNLPVSTRFDDPYYSNADGRAETAHVFVQGNRLDNRWRQMENCYIAELGFGTGLNFLETVSQWKLVRKPGSKLHFISFELYPLEPHEMEKALNAWPELGPLAKQLVSAWEGRNEASLDLPYEEDIRLTVIFADANAALPKQEFLADAWYLDGFSPAKNPQLWTPELMKAVFDHTVAGGTFATYSSAGFVRRNLSSAGFNVNKTKGFGKKREMLIGKKPNDIHVASEH